MVFFFFFGLLLYYTLRAVEVREDTKETDLTYDGKTSWKEEKENKERKLVKVEIWTIENRIWEENQWRNVEDRWEYHWL